MKVKELIELLKKEDPEAHIAMKLTVVSEKDVCSVDDSVGLGALFG